MAETTANPALNLYLPWLARHGKAYQNELNEVHISLPERVPFVERDDSIIHICKEGEYLPQIALHYYRNRLADPLLAWEVIAQFQEDPIVDASLPLKAGTVLLIPSVEFVQQVALGDPLHEFPEL